MCSMRLVSCSNLWGHLFFKPFWCTLVLVRSHLQPPTIAGHFSSVRSCQWPKFVISCSSVMNNRSKYVQVQVQIQIQIQVQDQNYGVILSVSLQRTCYWLYKSGFCVRPEPQLKRPSSLRKINRGLTDFFLKPWLLKSVSEFSKITQHWNEDEEEY